MWMCDDGVFECKLGINVWEKIESIPHILYVTIAITW